MQTCPTCDAPREGAVRYCPACGLDFWRAAAGETGRPVDSAVPATAPARSGFAPNFLAIGVIGVIVLGVAGVTSAVMLGVLRLDGAVIADRTARPLSDEDRLIHRFFLQVRDPDAAYAVSAEEVSVASGLPEELPQFSITADIRIHGEDWMGQATTVEGDEPPSDIEIGLVDGTYYTRIPEAGWEHGEEVPQRFWSISPFALISTVTEIEYVGSEIVDGERRHRLAVTKWLGGREFTDLLHTMAHIDSRESRMEIVVDDVGVPIVADLVMQIVATDDNEVTATFDLTATYRVTDWDAVEPIVPPI